MNDDDDGPWDVVKKTKERKREKKERTRRRRMAIQDMPSKQQPPLPPSGKLSSQSQPPSPSQGFSSHTLHKANGPAKKGRTATATPHNSRNSQLPPPRGYSPSPSTTAAAASWPMVKATTTDRPTPSKFATGAWAPKTIPPAPTHVDINIYPTNTPIRFRPKTGAPSPDVRALLPDAGRTEFTEVVKLPPGDNGNREYIASKAEHRPLPAYTHTAFERMQEQIESIQKQVNDLTKTVHTLNFRVDILNLRVDILGRHHAPITISAAAIDFVQGLDPTCNDALATHLQARPKASSSLFNKPAIHEAFPYLVQTRNSLAHTELDETQLILELLALENTALDKQRPVVRSLLGQVVEALIHNHGLLRANISAQEAVTMATPASVSMAQVPTPDQIDFPTTLGLHVYVKGMKSTPKT